MYICTKHFVLHFQNRFAMIATQLPVKLLKNVEIQQMRSLLDFGENAHGKIRITPRYLESGLPLEFVPLDYYDARTDYREQ